LPRCWYTQYDISAPRNRCGHHGCRRICRCQVCEVFQSSRTSWSSKIIEVGTVDSSQRRIGSPHASR
jgi:hypothetical protein